MKILTKAVMTASIALGLSACGGVSNTLPPTAMYPGTLTNQYNQPMTQLPATGTPNPLSNNTLPTDVSKGQFGSVVGRVISRSGAPLHNVEISLESDPTVKTASRRGDFTLMNVPIGTQNLILKFGELTTTVAVNVAPNMAVAPAQNPVLLDGEPGSNALAFASPNKQVASFKVDQDSFLNQWQAKGIDVSNGTIYISAIDVKSLIKKGTVIQMSTAGENWKDMASAWLGLRHPINSTARGLSMTSSGSILVVDEKSGMFTVDSTGKATSSQADGALDIASGGSTSWIYSVRGLEKSDDTGASRSPVSGVAATGGIGADAQGNAYVPVQNTIVKVSTSGSPTVLIRNYLHAPADVAVDPRNGDVFVLDGGEIKRYDKNGEFIVSFGSSALDPVGIDLDEDGSLYVADFARDSKSSQIIKFEAAPLPAGSVSASGSGTLGGSALVSLDDSATATDGLASPAEEAQVDATE